MTNTGLKEFLTEMGNRVCFIMLDNDRRIKFGYTDSDIKSVADLQYKTIGDEDFFGYSRPSTFTEDRAKGVTYTIWHRTDSIQQIGVMDEGFGDYRIDPVLF